MYHDFYTQSVEFAFISCLWLVNFSTVLWVLFFFCFLTILDLNPHRHFFPTGLISSQSEVCLLSAVQTHSCDWHQSKTPAQEVFYIQPIRRPQS